MAAHVRLLYRRAAAAASPSGERLKCSALLFRSLATASSTLDSDSGRPASKSGVGPRRVAVFWDLDNKPPKRVPPFEAASRLKEMAAAFGEVVDMAAYANHHAFAHVPEWVHEERRKRKVLSVLEEAGEVTPAQPYVCGVCGAKKKNHVQLTRHFKMLHEREQNKRIRRLDMLRGKKRQKERFRENNAEKMAKYKVAARDVIIPDVGYGLMQEIRRAGVYVRTVKDQPQAADLALKERMMRSIKRGVQCICLVSDDADFKPELRLARERHLHVVVVGDLRILGPYADTYFSWAEVASGRAEQRARILNGQLTVGDSGRAVSVLSDGEKSVSVSGFDEEGLSAEENTESGSESEVDDGQRKWRRVDWRSDEEWDKSFDSFSDSSSESDSDEEWDKSFDSSSVSSPESDSDESETDVKAKMQSKLQECRTISKTGMYGKVQAGFRHFTTKAGYAGQSHDERTAATEGESSVAETDVKKPEKLHHFFSMLESINKGKSSSGVTLPRAKTGEAKEGTARHFQRVQNILRSSVVKDVAESTVEKEWKETVEKVHDQEVQPEAVPVREVKGFSVPTNAQGAGDGEQRTNNAQRATSNGEEGISSGQWETTISGGQQTGNDQRETLDAEHETGNDAKENLSSSRRREGEGESGKQRRRPRIRMEPKNRKVIKVVKSGPRPFFITGFASESQADCDAINRYYAEFWTDEKEGYKGRQNRKRKS